MSCPVVDSRDSNSPMSLKQMPGKETMVAQLETRTEPVFHVLKECRDDVLQQSAELHVAHLSYRSFITIFGVAFIKELYRDLLNENNGFMVYCMTGSRVSGFALASFNSDNMFRIVKNNMVKYLRIMIPALVVRPWLMIKVIQTVFYSQKMATETKAEMVVIVTEPELRSIGMGTRLVDMMNEEFRRHDIGSYKVTVHDAMERSNNFYRKNGMPLSEQFTMYGVLWNVYVKDLAR